MRSRDRKRKELEEVQDLGRVLGTLLGQDRKTPPEAIVKLYLEPSLRAFRLDGTENEVALDKLPPLTIQPGARVFVGGGGVVIEATRCDLHSVAPVKRAIKIIPKPSLTEGSDKDAARAYAESVSEYFKHAPLSHKNVAQVFESAELTLWSKRGVPQVHYAFLTEWVEGARPLCQYLAHPASSTQDRITIEDVVDTLAQCCAALDYIHSRNLIHWDIKSENLLVDRDGVVKLMDVGNARRIDDPERGDTAFSTRGNNPLELLEPAVPSRRGKRAPTNRIPLEIPGPEWDTPWLDLWMLARDLNRLLGAVDRLLKRDEGFTLRAGETIVTTRGTFLNSVFPDGDPEAEFALSFLRLILRRLLNSDVPSQKETYYKQAMEVLDDLGKLLPHFGAAQAVVELQPIAQHILRLPVSGNVPYSRRIHALYNSPPIQRLSKHLQLGNIVQVYPGAGHRRSEHVAGVYGRAADYVRALYADRRDPFWRISVDGEDVDALLAAAILHDIGHVAFGHFLEEMSGLFDGRTHEDYAVLVLDPDRDAEEVRFGSRSATSARADRTQLLKALADAWGMPASASVEFLSRIANVIRLRNLPEVATTESSQLLPRPTCQLKYEILHSIIDSAIDADKLDYLLRDAHHCGVTYTNGIDVDRFFQALTAVAFFPGPRRHTERTRKGELVKHRASIGVMKKGILPVESLLASRYQMFGAVYWQHTTRAATAMFQFLVQSWLAAADPGSSFDDRLDLLLEKFRYLEDRNALGWLRRSLARARVRGETGDLLLGIVDAITGERRHLLYWRAFELGYERERGAKRGKPRSAEHMYAGLRDLSDRLNRPPERARYLDASQYLERATSLRRDFAQLLTASLKRSVAFADGEVLVDIPPAGKDQIDNIFVCHEDSVTPLQDMSPVADAVRESFRLWARKARVFLAPGAWAKCASVGLTTDDVWDACWQAIDQIPGQMSLF